MGFNCKKDKYYIYDKGKCVAHRSPIKVAINPFLRKVQFWTKYPYVIASKTDIDSDGIAHFGGYVFENLRRYEK